jgi:hypothetical protein
VHIRRIARGVPEDKWPFLLEEVSRVLKPEGAIEVVEEDLIFPGGQEPCTCHYPPEIDVHWYSDDGHDKPDSIDHSSSHGSNTNHAANATIIAGSASRSRSGTSGTSGTGELVANLSEDKTNHLHEEETSEKREYGGPSRTAEASIPVSSPTKHPRTIMTEGPKSPRNIPFHNTNRSMPHLHGDDGEFGQLPASHPSQPIQQDLPHRSTTLTARQLFHNVNWQNIGPSYDHSRLEQAYNDMHSSRFINLMPISVLTSQLNHYFREIQSHPPVLITFPPPEDEMWSEEEGSGTESGSVSNVSGGLSAASHFSPNFKFGMTPIAPTTSAETLDSTKQTKPWSSPTTQSSAVGSTTSSRVESSVDEHTSVSSPPPLAHATTQSQPHTGGAGGLFNLSSAEDDQSQYMMRPPVGGWHTLHVDARSLVNPKQPFIMIDRCRMPARTGPHQTMSRLPNQTFDMDLQSLTMHLSQSVTEVLECKESIWEWMVENKKARVKKQGIVPAGTSTPSGGVGGGLALGPSGTLKRPNADATIDRDEFDQWTRRYEKDMKARIGMAEAMRTRLGWNTKKGLNSSDEQTNRKMSLVPFGYPPGQEQSPLAVGLGLKSPSSIQQQHTRPRLNSTAHHSSSDVVNDPNHRTQFDGFASSTSLVGDDGAPTSGGETGALSDAAAMAIRQRTGSAPEHAIANAAHHVAKPSHGSRHSHKTSRSGGGHHSRAHSLDGANAWELLMHDNNQDMDRKTGTEDVPRLSRCIRVFVAWNNKEVESAKPEAAKK